MTAQWWVWCESGGYGPEEAHRISADSPEEACRQAAVRDWDMSGGWDGGTPYLYTCAQKKRGPRSTVKVTAVIAPVQFDTEGIS